MVDVLKRNNVRVIGDGEQSIIFAHGFGCDQNVWRHLIPAFQSTHKLVLFDYVGAGGSDITAYDSKKYNSLDGYASDILDVCNALKLKDPIFIGHSVSAMTGVRAAALKQSYFNKLVFICPSPCYINDKEYVGGMEKSDILGLLEMMDSNYLGWSASLGPMVMGNADRPELGDELTANFCATDPNIAKEFARVTFLTDSRKDLEKVQVPSLTLQCRNDVLAPLEVGYYIQEHMHQNTLKLIDAEGHCPHLSEPEETIAAIRSFLDVEKAVIA